MKRFILERRQALAGEDPDAKLVSQEPIAIFADFMQDIEQNAHLMLVLCLFALLGAIACGVMTAS